MNTIMHEIADFCVDHEVCTYIVVISTPTDAKALYTRLDAQRELLPDAADAILVISQESEIEL